MGWGVVRGWRGVQLAPGGGAAGVERLGVGEEPLSDLGAGRLAADVVVEGVELFSVSLRVRFEGGDGGVGLEVGWASLLPGLTDALVPYDDSQVAHAVATTARMVRHGAINKSPLGWLVKKARQADPDFFPIAQPQPDQPTRASPHPDPRQQRSPSDLQADAAVTALEADPERHREQLDALDHHIRAETPSPKIRQRLFSNPQTLHASRATAWRQLHPPPSSDHAPPQPEAS